MCLSGDESQHNRHRDECRARGRSSTNSTDERYNAETESQCRSPQKTQIVFPLIKAQMGTDNSPPKTAQMGTDSCSLPKMQIGAKTQERPQMTQITQSDKEEAQIARHKMQQREVSLAHNLLEIMLPYELRIWIIK